MAALDAAIQEAGASFGWMAGSSPAMTRNTAAQET